MVVPPPQGGGRMDNWAVDKWRFNNLEIQMSDGGYSRSILAFSEEETLLWRADDYDPCYVRLHNITPEQFAMVCDATVALTSWSDTPSP